MPHLQELWSELSSERDDVVFLCVNAKDPAPTIAKYWGQGPYTMQAVRDPGARATGAMRVAAFPTNYVIGPDGRVRFRGVGFDPRGFERLKRALAAALPQESPAENGQ